MRKDQVKIAKSCGCVRGVKANPISPYKRLYRKYKRGAVSRNLEFDISFKSFQKYIKDNCFYCGQAPSNIICSKFKGSNCITYNGLDRINNLRDYNEVNVCTCCTVCNFMKSSLTQKEFIKKVKCISAHLKSCELLETPEEDNQQPSLSGDTLEGSTTRNESHVDNNFPTSAGHSC